MVSNMVKVHKEFEDIPGATEGMGTMEECSAGLATAIIIGIAVGAAALCCLGAVIALVVVMMSKKKKPVQPAT